MSFILLIFIIILAMISYGSFSNKFISPRFMNGSRTTKVFTGYLVVLLCTGIISFILPKGESYQGDYLTDEEIQQNERINGDVYSIVESGKIEEAEGLTKMKSWEFPLEGKSLNINALSINATVFIEKVKSLENQVEVTHYSTFSYIDNIDITDRFTSPEIQLSETTLKVFPQEPVNVKLVKYTNAFPFNQFAENGEQFNGGYGMMQGLNFIYIKVPMNTEVSGNGYVINE
ncbi:hypothetical protein QNH36_04190 [Mesobacillus sp. AQ2]|jgi:hypothetical protein|uniref:hypothetical protein n=1 Tax=Bacillaceae TaxID=186817 RepID=UPI0011A8BD5E|nr:MULTISPECIES: hypothetical protein [Bacillaceae]MCM3125526.1 hypothetical protein [Mesobacillus sp. MER 33]MCM3234430.1 hypothetical protein [Mesobacillus sp. MER 48]WHX41366.1 hypothetical protein QNH36_04190 [Mesobacillus sp. AQ2]